MKAQQYELGEGVTVYHGDALAILPELAAGSVHALITDPPYSSGGMVRGDRMQSTWDKYQSTTVPEEREHPNFTGDNRDQRGFLAWASLWAMYALDVVQPGGLACCFADWRQLPSMTDALQAGGWVWRGILPWDKVNGRPMPNRPRNQCEYVAWASHGPRNFDMVGATYHPGILRALPPPPAERVHSTQKPVAIMCELVGLVRPGEVVLDPFMGSAATGMACIQTGRRFVGVEKDAEQFRRACARLEAELQQGRVLVAHEPAPVGAGAGAQEQEQQGGLQL